MFKILKMPDANRFLKIVEQSHGQVLVQLPDGSQCDLKQDHVAKEIVRTMQPREDGICIDLSDKRDLPAFVRYLVGERPA